MFYEVSVLNRLASVMGDPCTLVRRNSARDFSILTPLVAVSIPVQMDLDVTIERGAIVVRAARHQGLQCKRVSDCERTVKGRHYGRTPGKCDQLRCRTDIVRNMGTYSGFDRSRQAATFFPSLYFSFFPSFIAVCSALRLSFLAV